MQRAGQHANTKTASRGYSRVNECEVPHILQYSLLGLLSNPQMIHIHSISPSPDEELRHRKLRQPGSNGANNPSCPPYCVGARLKSARPKTKTKKENKVQQQKLSYNSLSHKCATGRWVRNIAKPSSMEHRCRSTTVNARCTSSIA
jgi:hypothetical protein